MGLVNDTCVAMIAELPGLKKRKNENDREHQTRLSIYFSMRWGREAVTIRSWRNGNRRPDHTCKRFFSDLKKYIGKTLEQFLESEPSGYKPELHAASKSRPAKRRRVAAKKRARVAK